MGFAQEMKDFFGAAEKTYKTLDDAEYNKIKRRYMTAQSVAIEDKNNDEEGHSLDKEYKRQQINSLKARQRLMGQQGQLYGARIKALNQPAIGVAPTEVPVLDGAQGYGAAIPVTPPSNQPAIGPQSSLSPDEEEQPTGFAARGGLIQKFVDGGMVEDDDVDVEAPAPAIGGDETDFSSQSRPKYSVDAANDAVAAGLRYGTAQFAQPGAVMTPQRRRAMNAYVRGQDAVTPQEMEAVYKKIDPQHRLTDSERNISALGAVWQYKMSKNDTVGAQKAAYQLLQHMRVASQRYAAISAAAVEHGDVAGAVKAAVKSYASIPDGRDLKVEQTPDGQLKYSIVDQQTGKTLQGGIATPQQLAAQAMNVASKGFDQFLLESAGQRAAKGQQKGAIDPNAPMKVGDKKSVLEQVDAAFDSVAPKDEKSGEVIIPAAEQRTLRGATFRISADPRNNRIRPDEAAAAVLQMASPDPKKPDEQTFKAKKADGGFSVQFGKGPAVFVPEDDFTALAMTRAEKIAALRKQSEEDKKPGLLSGAVDAAGEAIGAIGNYVSDLRDRNKKAIGNMEADDSARDREFLATKRREIEKKRDEANGR